MFLHLDMDYFFAQAEELRHPETKGKIVIVGVYSGRTPDSGVVSAVNYQGRKIGIKAGMPLLNAKKLVTSDPTLFYPMDRTYYEKLSFKIDQIIRKYCEKVVQASIDEWNIEDNAADQKAHWIKGAIKKETGLTCTIGGAPSPLGAKMIAGKAKPDGLKLIGKDAEKEMIGYSLVGEVPGIGPKTTEALNEFGIVKVMDIAEHSNISLVETFGRKTGAWLINLGKGEYSETLGEEKEQDEVSRIGTLKDRTRAPEEITRKIRELEKDAKEWLVQMKKAYKTITIIFITEDMKTHTKSLSFRNPRMWSDDGSREIRLLIDSFLNENNLEVRRVGIRFGNFVDMGGQTTLF